MQQKKWIGFLVAIVVVFVIANVVRDAGIQSDRESTARLIAEYEQNVQKADGELQALESEPIAFGDLEEIAKLQAQIVKTSELLIGLAPVLNSPGKVNRYSSASVNAFNRSVRSYNTNIGVYQSQMSELNGIVDRANKQYEIKIVTPASLDRALLSTDKKFWEIVGIAQAPTLEPSSRIEEVNKGIVARSEKQKTIRDSWNRQAQEINKTNANINSLRAKTLDLYGTKLGGIRIDAANNVKTGS